MCRAARFCEQRGPLSFAAAGAAVYVVNFFLRPSRVFSCEFRQAFLNNVGLGTFYPKFEENAIFTVEDLCDASLISDKELVTEIGFNAEQVRNFSHPFGNVRRGNCPSHGAPVFSSRLPPSGKQ